jgi:uncharacterized membrane protein YedE/YeeE
MFESPYMLVMGLLTGVAFGFLLQKGQVAKYEAILGQLLLRDWTVFKVMGTAVVVGSVGVYALVAAGAARLDVWPLQVAAVLLGAVLFGIGLAVFGYCPGTGLAGSGEGSRDAMVGVLGMITGAGVFVAAFDLLQPLAVSLGDYGKVTVPELLGVPPWAAVLALVAAAGLAFWLAERHERRGLRRTSPAGEDRQKAGGWGWSPGTTG